MLVQALVKEEGSKEVEAVLEIKFSVEVAETLEQ